MSKSTPVPKKTFRVHVTSVSLRDLRGEESNGTPQNLYAKISFDSDTRSREEVQFSSKDGGKQFAVFKLHKGYDLFWYDTFELETFTEKNIYIDVWAEKNIFVKKKIGSTTMSMDKIVVGPVRQELILRFKDKVTGKLEFNLEMTQVCYDAQCLISEVKIKRWDYKKVHGAEVLLLEHQYDDGRGEKAIRSQVKERKTAINEFVEEPTWRNVDLLTITRIEFPLMKKARVLMKVSYQDPSSKEYITLGLATIALPKYYHVNSQNGVQFSEPLINSQSGDSQFKIEGKILFMDGPVLCQMSEGKNTENRFVDPKYPDFPEFDFGRFKTLSSKNLRSLEFEDGVEIDGGGASEKLEEHKETSFTTLSDQDEIPMTEEEKMLQEEFQYLQFEKQKAVEFTQNHLLQIRDVLIEEIETNANLDNEIKDLETILKEKEEEIDQLEQRLEVRKRGVSREIYQDENERPGGRLSWFEHISDMNQSYKSLALVDGRFSREENVIDSDSDDSDYEKITKDDLPDDIEGSPSQEETADNSQPTEFLKPKDMTRTISTTSSEQHHRTDLKHHDDEFSDDDGVVIEDTATSSPFSSPPPDLEAQATREAEISEYHDDDIAATQFMSYDEFKHVHEQMPKESPEMFRHQTEGGTMYEIPTEVVNELMKNFEDDRSLYFLLRNHGGDPDKVYEWLSHFLHVPPCLPKSPYYNNDDYDEMSVKSESVLSDVLP